MNVCMFVTVLRLKYTGLWYLWHVPFMMPSRAMAHGMEIEVEDSGVIVVYCRTPNRAGAAGASGVLV